MNKLFTVIFVLSSYIITAQSFYPIERNKSRFETLIKNNRVKSRSVNAGTNSSAIKPLVEYTTYTIFGKPDKKIENKEGYSSVTNYKYNRELQLTHETCAYVSTQYFDSNSLRFNKNLRFQWNVPATFKKASYQLAYMYNEANKLNQLKIATSYDDNIDESLIYSHLYEYDKESKGFSLYEKINNSKQKIKEFFYKKDTVQYNVFDAKGHTIEEHIYDINNRVYTQKKYRDSENLIQPYTIQLQYFGKDYRLLKEEDYLINSANDDSFTYTKINMHYMYDYKLDLSEIIKTDEQGKLLEKTINNYTDNGLLNSQTIMNAQDKIESIIEYTYEFYE